MVITTKKIEKDSICQASTKYLEKNDITPLNFFDFWNDKNKPLTTPFGMKHEITKIPSNKKVSTVAGYARLIAHEILIVVALKDDGRFGH